MQKRFVAFMLVSCTAFVVMLAPAHAQTNGDAQSGRYTMVPAPDGFLRMDTRSGAVSLCTLKDGNVSCASSSDERAALANEISRLSKENADLRERLAQVTQQGGRLGSTAPPNSGTAPTDSEMDKALGFAETFMRRMMRIMREEAPRGERL